MIRKFDIDPTIATHLNNSWHGEVCIARVNDFDEKAASRLHDDISQAHLSSQKEVIVLIDSFGGQVYSLASMVSAFEGSKKKIVTAVEGKAMSCGAFLLGFGTIGRRYASPNSIIMFHNISGFAYGNPDDMKASTEHAEALQEFWCKKLAKHCGHKNENYFIKLLEKHKNADIYMTPEEAKQHKLIDHIGIPTVTAKVTFDVIVE